MERGAEETQQRWPLQAWALRGHQSTLQHPRAPWPPSKGEPSSLILTAIPGEGTGISILQLRRVRHSLVRQLAQDTRL